MGKKYYKISVSEEVYNMIKNDCLREFLKNNPDFKDIYVTEDLLLLRMARYYLR